MKFGLHELGNLREMADWEADVWAEGSHREMLSGGEAVKKDVRADIRRARIKNAGRLGNAWRGKIFPRSPKAHAAKPAYVIGNNASHILDTFEKGGEINAKGAALLIPIGPARRIKLAPGQPRTMLPELARRQYGVARLVSHRLKRTREVVLGVWSAAEGVRKFIPLFRLRKSVQAPNLLNAEDIIETAGKRLPDQHARGVWARFEAALAREGRSASVAERSLVVGG